MESEIGLSTIILISSNNSTIFNKKKIIEKLLYLFKKSNGSSGSKYFVLKNDKESLAIMDSHGSIKSDEFLIFKIDIDTNKITLVNLFNGFYKNKDLEYFYKTIDKLNYCLWRSLPKIETKDTINIYNEKVYFYNLKENSIFRLGNVKFLIREFHIFQNNNNPNRYINNTKQKIFLRVILETYENDICEICGKKYSTPDDPIVKLCLCKKYRHYKCMKDKFKEILIEDENNGCSRFFLKTNCMYCKRYIPWNFLLYEDNKYKLFELIDIPRKKEEEYLLLETFDFSINNQGYVKYIYYIKFRGLQKNKNVETILIGGDRKKSDKYIYNKLVKVEGDRSISSQHALIDYDIEEKTLIIRNISDTHNTLILEDNLVINKYDKNKLYLELGNIKIESQLVEKNQFNEIEENLKDNANKIEIREEEEN